MQAYFCWIRLAHFCFALLAMTCKASAATGRLRTGIAEPRGHAPSAMTYAGAADRGILPPFGSKTIYYNSIIIFLHKFYYGNGKIPVESGMEPLKKLYLIPREFCKIAEFQTKH